MMKVGKMTIYSEDDQRLFRRVLDTKGEQKKQAIKDLILQKLDLESAVVPWLKRNHNYDLYLIAKAEIDREKAAEGEPDDKQSNTD